MPFYHSGCSSLWENGTSKLQLCALPLRRDGSVYKGSKFNVLTVVALASILTPLAGLVFAWWSYGVLWG